MNDDELQAALGPVAPPQAAAAAAPAQLSDDELQAAVGPAAAPAEGPGILDHLQTFGEGLAQGATLGGYGLVTSLAARNGVGVDSLLSPDYDKERRAREAQMPLTAMAGNVAGAVAPTLLSGGATLPESGASITRSVAAAMPSAIEANLGVKLAGVLGEKAAAWVGSSTAAKLGVRALATGIESAADQAVRRVLDDAANGDVDVTAERALGAAWDGFRWGSAVDLGLGMLGAAGRGIKAGSSKAMEAAQAKVGDISDAAGEAAYKAALGRTDINEIRRAARHGGAADVGKTLLSRGLVRSGDTVDDIAARLPAAREQAGQELRSVLDEVKDETTARAPIWSRIERDVIEPLDKPGSADVAQAVRAKLSASGISSALSDAGSMKPRTITLGELHQLRKTLDSRPDLKWGSAGPQAPDITTEAMRDVRRAIENAFEEASDDAARRAGVEGYADKLKAAKRAYAHLATAAHAAEQGAFARASRNRLGLNDTLAGVGTMAAVGPIGALGALGSKLVRERFEATVASGLYGIAKKQQAAQAVRMLADGAVKTEQAITRHADDAVRNIFAQRTKVGVASELASVGALSKAMDRAAALQRPDSPESAAFAQHIESLSMEDPALAQAIGQKMQARAQFLASKMAPVADPSDPLGREPGAQDSATTRRNMRYVTAALDPQGALQRMAQGVGSVEDVETLRALTPRLYQRYVQQVHEKVSASKRAPTLRERRQLAYMTGMPMERAGDPATARWLQTLQVPPPTAKLDNPNLAPVKPQQRGGASGGSSGEENRWASRTDTLLE